MKKTLILALAGFGGLMQLAGQENNLVGVRVRDQIGQVISFGAGVSLNDSLNNGFSNRLLMGRPFSATEERRSTQNLANGTRIETSRTNRLFRDSDGRTRVEAQDGNIVIVDPVAGFRADLNPKTHVVLKMDAPGGLGRGATKGPGPAYAGTPAGISPAPGGGRSGGKSAGPAIIGAGGGPVLTTPGETRENLSTQIVNGVLARGVRTTLLIARGQIGNDREIKVVTEQWTSDDLQMLIKSVNNDPRFGDTTYELTKISLGSPDPALFQIPADYLPPMPPAPGTGRSGAGGRGGVKGGGPPKQ